MNAPITILSQFDLGDARDHRDSLLDPSKRKPYHFSMKLRLGNTSEFIELNLPSKLYRKPSEAPYEWNRINARISAGAWASESIAMNFLTTEIIEFLQQLPALFRNLTGEAKLTSMEGWIELTIKAERLGGIKISGFAKDQDDGNRLHFQISADQSFFPNVPGEVEKYLAAQHG